MLSLSNLKLRILSSLILIPVVIGLLYAGGWMFGIFVALVFGLCCGEWFEMTRSFPRRAVYLLSGFAYFAVSFVMFTQMRVEYAHGFLIILSLMIAVWASDTGAYILGRTLRGPKLAPSISPNKTWAGLIGAILGAGIALAIMLSDERVLPGVQVGRPVLMIYGGLLGIVGQAGDLLESYMKRRAGLKDSGTLIPGHGGILDRIDALLLAIPLFYVIITFGV